MMNTNKKIKALLALDYEENKKYLLRPTKSMEEFLSFKQEYQTKIADIMKGMEYLIFDLGKLDDESKKKLYKNAVDTIKRLENDKSSNDGIIAIYFNELALINTINGLKDAAYVYVKIAKPKKYKIQYNKSIKLILKDNEILTKIGEDIKESAYAKSFVENGKTYNKSTKVQLESAYKEFEKMTDSILARYKRIALALKPKGE